MSELKFWQPKHWNCCTNYMDSMPNGCHVNTSIYGWCPCKEWMERKNKLKGRFNYGYVVNREHYE